MSTTASSSVSTSQLTRLRMALGRLGRVLRQQSADGLSYPQLSLLFAVEREQPVTATALAGLERVSPPAVSRTLNELEMGGLIVRTASAADRRSARVQLTHDGQQECERLRGSRDAWLSAHLTCLDRAETEALLGALPALEKLCDATWGDASD